MIDSLEECFLLTNAPAQLTFTLSVSLLRFPPLLANFAAKVRINFDRLRINLIREGDNTVVEQTEQHTHP